MQAEVAIARQPRDVLAAANLPAEVQKRAARAHLESNVASALALQSPLEWRRWLVTYVRQLAVDEDEVGACAADVGCAAHGGCAAHQDCYGWGHAFGRESC